MNDLANFRMGPLPPPDQKEMEERIHDALLAETARSAWLKWATEREAKTTFRRDKDRLDEFLFIEGFKQGVQRALQERTGGEERRQDRPTVHVLHDQHN